MESRSTHTRKTNSNSYKPETPAAPFAKPYRLSVESGDLLWLDGHWYVTHSGLIRLARRNRCSGIHVEPVTQFSDPVTSRWAFKATVYKSRTCRGFVGYGDADPSNVSSLVHGAEMRVAETRAVNRALRNAYGIGICSVEEIGSVTERTKRHQSRRSYLRNRAMGTTVLRRFVTDSARLSASINSILTWLRLTPPTSAAWRLFAMPPASRWRTL